MAFNWARMVTGQKVTNALLDAESKAKADAAQQIIDEQAKIRREEYEQERQKAALKTKAEFEKQKHARETARIAEEAREKERAAETTREKGHWCFYNYPIQYEGGESREVDLEFNERVIRWVQQWFTVWGDVLCKLETLGELEQKYYEHWCPWLIKQFSRDSSAVESYIAQNDPSADALTQYKLIQQWVLEQEKPPGSRPWEEFRVWTPAKHITWAKVLRVLSKKSVSFEKGIIDITNDKTKPYSEWKVTWNVTFPYKTVRFKVKPLTPAQLKRKQKEYYDE